MRHVQVVGTGCAKCTKLTEAVQEIVSELPIAAAVEKVSDLNRMAQLGIIATPALVIDGEVKACGRIPTGGEIRRWLMDDSHVAETEQSTGAALSGEAAPCCGQTPADPPAVLGNDCCASTATAASNTCCGTPPPEIDWSQHSGDAPWIIDQLDTPAGPVPRVCTAWSWRDRLGAWKARWGMGRLHYWVKPRLYAVGVPDAQSPVFVTANYKMTFDRLRTSLDGRDGWILVLDTRGINVWCAAGKGTFGTDELVRQVEAVKLAQVVKHRRLTVPQLGAVGVAAHEVRERSGFRVQYGPVRCGDLPVYLDSGMKATPAMRRVEFPLKDRLSVAVVELVLAAKPVLGIILILILLGGLGRDVYSLHGMLVNGGRAVVFFLSGFLAGALLGPALLPWLPGRAFSLKGVWIGLVMTALLWAHSVAFPQHALGPLDLIAWTLLLPTITSFTVMNYTGSTTYTSLSGVRRELRRAVPVQIVCSLAGLAIWIAARFV